MAANRDSETETELRVPLDLTAPRRVFKRKRRSGLILALKILFPTMAVAGIAFVVIWSQKVLEDTRITPEVVKDVGKSTSSVTVTQVKYDGLDAQNRPFTITAESANEPPNTSGDQNQAGSEDKSSLINLYQPKADITLVNGAWVALTADSGVYDRDSGVVDLSGNVTLYHDTGLSFQTDAATIDLKNETASGSQPIEGQRPDGSLAAEGFEVRDNGQTVIFTGRAYMKLFPKSGTPDSGESSGVSGEKG